MLDTLLLAGNRSKQDRLDHRSHEAYILAAEQTRQKQLDTWCRMEGTMCERGHYFRGSSQKASAMELAFLSGDLK